MGHGRHRLAVYLAHIVEAIERIGVYTEGMSEAAFLSNRLVQDAVARNMEIVGEASHNIETHFPEFAATHPELPLSSAYEMRDAMAHGYFKVDYELVWRTVRDDLPGLRVRVQATMADLPQAGEGADR